MVQGNCERQTRERHTLERHTLERQTRWKAPAKIDAFEPGA
jgi:hypothetical protein